MNRASASAGILAALALAIAPAAAQDAYPSRLVRIVVGFGPASAADIVARVLAQRLGASLHQ